ncbi:hypothetical protein EDD11_004812 [Mortierella claussenii]|nr:hypothetical protein EDD11_004812 [Mortierella claussenii]
MTGALCLTFIRFRPRQCSKALLYLVAGCFVAWLPMVYATIQCASPNNGTYKAGDTIILDWTSDGSYPKVVDIDSLKATLVCDSGVTITNTVITSWANAYTWSVPNVGNAITPGGTVGTCPANSFHIIYEGEVKYIPFINKAFKAECKSFIILPGANNPITTVTTTTQALTTPASTASSTKASKTTTSTDTLSPSLSPSPTDLSGTENDSKPKTFIIVIVAIVAGVILFLVAFGTWWYLRKQRIKRMENAIMPWSKQSENPFSKVSSMDEGHRSPGNFIGRSPGVAAATAGAGAADAAAVAAKYGSNKPQPQVPQSSHGYYQNNSGYGQQGVGGGYGTSHDGYSNNNEDEYYNPYYAQGGKQSYTQSPAGTNASYYSGNQTPYQGPHDLYQQQQHQAGGTYFPPPPPVTSDNRMMLVPSSGPGPSNLTATTLVSSTNAAASPGRAPQVILPENGHPIEKSFPIEQKGPQSIPMKDLGPNS